MITRLNPYLHQSRSDSIGLLIKFKEADLSVIFDDGRLFRKMECCIFKVFGYVHCKTLSPCHL